MRDDLARPRGGFRTREDGTLPMGECGQCKGETYQVPAGDWLHWATLGVDCPKDGSTGQEGAILAADGLTIGEGVS